jgi:hypothetical protein
MDYTDNQLDDFYGVSGGSGGGGGSAMNSDTGTNNLNGIWGSLGAGVSSYFNTQATNKANTNAAKIKAGSMVTIALYVVGGLIVIAVLGFFLKRK